jgi:hypothetical protein
MLNLLGGFGGVCGEFLLACPEKLVLSKLIFASF